MNNPSAPFLQGDGIKFSFFHNLWMKNRSQEKQFGKRYQVKYKGPCNMDSVQLRLPDTVVFRLGQPWQWYFTSERGGQPSILRKRKQNLNIEKIEEVFIHKGRSANQGWLDSKNDILAYFISSSSNETNTSNHQMSKFTCGNVENLPNIIGSLDGGAGADDHLPNNASQEDDYCNDSCCNIQYFNEERLRQFLHQECMNQTGILQLFVYPSGGANHNSQIRAICTPKMCLLERRKTKQNLHDKRFGLYERAVTFEGPQVYSESLPINGCALSGQLQELCGKVLKDISESSPQNKSQKHREGTDSGDMRMVLNLKVDSRNRIWILYTSSIRVINHGGNKTHLQEDIQCLETRTFTKSQTSLNLHDVISISPNTKLTQYANHNPHIQVSNRKSIALCPSCGKMSAEEHFYSVPYKTIITHFEKVMELSSITAKPDCCPIPSLSIIKMAGGVGFGTLSDDYCNQNEDDNVIPPVIRFLHHHMTAEGYRCYRSDALFLHKKCKVCENCFLAYAKYVSTSVDFSLLPMNKFSNIFEEDSHCYCSLSLDAQVEKGNRKKLPHKERVSVATTNEGAYSSPLKKSIVGDRDKLSTSSLDCLFVKHPTLPPTIANPQEVLPSADKNNTKPMSLLPFHVMMRMEESPSPPYPHPLMHLMHMQAKKNTKKINSNNTVTKSEEVNPYKITLRLVDSHTNSKKTQKKKNFDNGNLKYFSAHT